MNVRERILQRAATRSSIRPAPFESALLKDFLQAFLTQLSAVLSRRLSCRVALSVANRERSSESQLYYALKVFQARLSFGVPPELCEELVSRLLQRPVSPVLAEPDAENLGLLRDLVLNVLREEKLFSSSRVFLLESFSGQPHDEWQTWHPLDLECTCGGAKFILPAYVEDLFLERLRIYAKVRAAPLLRRMKPNVRWIFSIRRALHSFDMLLQLSPGKRISIRRLLSERCEIRQESKTGARFPLKNGANVTIKKAARSEI